MLTSLSGIRPSEPSESTPKLPSIRQSSTTQEHSIPVHIQTSVKTNNEIGMETDSHDPSNRDAQDPAYCDETNNDQQEQPLPMAECSQQLLPIPTSKKLVPVTHGALITDTQEKQSEDNRSEQVTNQLVTSNVT